MHRLKPLVARSLTVPKKGMWDRQLSKKATPQYNYKRGPFIREVPSL